ncbi:hypothetical protein NQ317_005751 [Molorchus minor]|uniref:carbonic anhydrase n=1 Tax=Molorchus minor TaxID=1323400 RepID=A0ABQ9IRI4_9CUCU|nr:hypothetical protein NQ317_005751 [Molorchus minor]
MKGIKVQSQERPPSQSMFSGIEKVWWNTRQEESLHSKDSLENTWSTRPSHVAPRYRVQKLGSSTIQEADGERQSPIDINPIDLKILNANRKLEWKYIPENALDITNTGYCWKVHVDGQGSEPNSKDDVIYVFCDGKFFEDIRGELWVQCIMCEMWAHCDCADCKKDDYVGKKHHEIEKIVDHLMNIEYKGQTVELSEPLNPARFYPNDTSYYTYQGSLTTPPCSECVVWIVFKESIEISPEQLQTFRNLKSYTFEETCPCDEFQGYVKYNVRPTCPVGKREC